MRAAHALEDRVLSRPGGQCLGPFYMQVTGNVSPWGLPCSRPVAGQSDCHFSGVSPRGHVRAQPTAM